ncbi:MAG: hypothetical protein KGZ74_13490 [Chitinophagaceae bacterium]|nr:hypothetical protein [Chitinophagaceae bacterium]
MKSKLFFSLSLLFVTYLQSYSQTSQIRNELDRVIQQLNDSLHKYDERGRTVHLLSDSVFSVKNRNGSFITVNIKRLESSRTDSLHQMGIDFLPIDYKTHVPGNWIYFQQRDKMTRLMFQKATEAEAKQLYYLFLELRKYMQALLR